MKKPAFLLAAVLLVLLAAVTMWKSRQAPVGVSDGALEPTAAEKEDVRRFWEVYRQATRHRLAGRLAEAAAAYREALTLNDRHEDALYYLGNVRMERGEYAAAREAWERLAHVNPNSARAFIQLGDLHVCFEQDTLFDLAAAEVAFRRALEINKEETGPLLRLGQLALLRGDLAEAHRSFAAVVGSNYRSVEAHFFTGYLAWKAGDAREAVGHFAQAVRYARPEAPAGKAPGEGDTKAGQAPLTSEAAGCPLFGASIDGLGRVEESRQSSEADRRYRALDTLLASVRKRRGGLS